MPIYAFACDACSHAFDRLQKLSDADPSECPECKAPAVRRRLTAPQFRLAGGGWYETDFKKEGDSKRNLAGEGGEGAKPPAEAKAETKTDAKAGVTPDAKPLPKAGDAAGVAPKPAPPKPEPAKPASSA